MRTLATHHALKTSLCTASSSMLLCCALQTPAAPVSLETEPRTRVDRVDMSLPPNAALLLQHPLLATPLQPEAVLWSLNGKRGWYVDVKAANNRFDSERQADIGRLQTVSVVSGFPIQLGGHWVLEPQAQLINQRVAFDGQSAEAANTPSNHSSGWSGRVGARLAGSYQIRGLPVEPYVRTHIWHGLGSEQTLSLDQVEKISSGSKSATVEIGLGLVARVSPNVSLYVSADYSSDVDDNDINGLIGNLGVRLRW